MNNKGVDQTAQMPIFFVLRKNDGFLLAFITQASLCSCAGWNEPHLDEIRDDRFCRDGAHVATFDSCLDQEGRAGVRSPLEITFVR